MPTLWDKIFGCLAASRISSAIGAVVEGWSPEQIARTYGRVDRLYEYKQVATGLALAPRAEYRREIERALEIAGRRTEYKALRAEFYQYYNGIGAPYAAAKSNETVSKAFAVLAFAKGDVVESILDGVNFGRDADCLAASAGGVAGALNGAATIPAAWIEQVDAATAATPYTSVSGTIREHADGIHGALQQRAARMRALADLIDARQVARAA